MTTARLRELKALLDGLAGRVEFEEEPTPEERVIYDETIANFRRVGPVLLDQATEHLWAYYHRVASAFTPEEREAYGIPELDQSVDIWDEVAFENPPWVVLGGQPRSPGRSYLSFEGEVSWEPEHGLQLVFEEGLRVCKVGPYDGHVTNARAFADDSLLGVVFR